MYIPNASEQTNSKKSLNTLKLIGEYKKALKRLVEATSSAYEPIKTIQNSPPLVQLYLTMPITVIVRFAYGHRSHR